MVTDVLTAPDPAVVTAMRFAFERMKVVLEPSGASALAVLMEHREKFRGQRVVIDKVLSRCMQSARFDRHPISVWQSMPPPVTDVSAFRVTWVAGEYFIDMA